MTKQIIGLALCAMLFALSFPAEAQQAKKVPWIGVLFPGFPSTYSLRSEAFLQGMRDLGYVDGKTIKIEWRWAEDRVEKLPDLAAELVRLKVDVIVSSSTPAAKALKTATSTIPIVMALIGDPVGTGLVASLARPGGNLTGLTNIAQDLSAKRLELLNEVVPSASRVAAMLNPTNPLDQVELKETQLAARKLGVHLQPIEASDSKSLQEAFATMTRKRVRGLVVLTDGIFYSQRVQIVQLATKNRLPAVYFQPEFTADGGLMSYAPNTDHFFHRSALYVDKILKGAKPADLPVEQPTKFELIINLKAAKQIGLTIPPNVLVRADKVIR
jgi:putative tryptophan/tyrosine transport system substrate-binding protein